ncbi:hypothetical protein D3C85_1241100 [compost metagenome]
MSIFLCSSIHACGPARAVRSAALVLKPKPAAMASLKWDDLTVEKRACSRFFRERRVEPDSTALKTCAATLADAMNWAMTALLSSCGPAFLDYAPAPDS